MNVNDLITQWRTVVKQRQELDRLSRELKVGPEAALKSQILMYLDSQNLPGVKSGVGTVSRTTKDHMEVTDLNVLLEKQYELFNKAKAEGRPLSDALLLQRTPVKAEITSYVLGMLGLDEKAKPTDDEFNAAADALGIRRVSTLELSFRSAR